MEKKYFAFISYKSEDVEWAVWLQHELEHYHLPASYNGRDDIRQDLRPIFRDIDELRAGNLPEQIQQALKDSENLIVICSPQSAKSPWVNDEVKTFISLGRTNQIFPFIVEGNSPQEFFPPTLLALPKNLERLGGDVSKNGRDAAFVKIVAGMLNVEYDSLWNRYEKEKAEQERIEREKRDNLFRMQSRFIAEKAIDLTNNGDPYLAQKILLEVLPKNIELPDRPYTIEAEAALRFSNLKFHIRWGKGERLINEEIFKKNNYNLICCGDTGNLTFVSNEEKYITTSREGEIQIHDSAGLVLKNIKAHDGRISDASICPSGNYIVSFSSSDKSIKMWSRITGSSVWMRHIYNYRINSVSFSHDSKLLIVSTQEGSILMFNARTGSAYRIYECHEEAINCAVFSPGGKYFATGSNDRYIKIWDVRSGEEIKRLGGHEDDVNCIAYSHDGRFLVSASKDETIRLWDMESGETIDRYMLYSRWVKHLCFSPEDKYIAAFVDEVLIWKINISHKLEQSVRLSCHEDYSPTGDKKAVRSGYHTFSVYNNQGDHELLKLNHYGEATSISFSPDGKYILSTSGVYNEGEFNKFRTEDNAIRVWDSSTGELLLRIEGHDDLVRNAVYSPDEKNILSSSADNTIRIWDAATGKELWRKSLYAYYTQYSPTGRKIVVASFKEILIIDTETKKTTSILKGHELRVNHTSFSADEKYIVSASDDRTIRVWDIETSIEILKIPILYGSIDYVTFSHDSKYIYSNGSYGIRIWDFQPLQYLINKIREQLEDYPLTPEERKKYYLD